MGFNNAPTIVTNGLIFAMDQSNTKSYQGPAITNLAQLSFAFDYAGRAPFNEPSGREVLGHHALSHFYKTAEGWLYLDSKPSELPQLERVEGLAGISAAADVGELFGHGGGGHRAVEGG